MSALHWICALTLALVCCLSAQPVTRHADEISWAKEMIFPRLDILTKFTKNNCPDDTKLYSPTDIRKDCLSSALNCTKKELFVLKAECNLNEEMTNVFENLYTELDYDAETETSSSSSSCQACELYPEQDVQQFLKAIRDLVERW